MTPKNTSATGDEQHPELSRRTIVRAAAWSLPVIAVAAGTPLAAASVGVIPRTDVFLTPSAGPIAVTPPVGAKFVTFELIGGVGGTRGAVGAGGGLVTGTIGLIGTETFTYWVGEGGTSGVDNVVSQPVAGGRGYGVGGTTTTAGAAAGWNTTMRTGGSGGGASALYINGAPVAVAGGSGGGDGFAAVLPAGAIPGGWTAGGYPGIAQSTNTARFVVAQRGQDATTAAGGPAAPGRSAGVGTAQTQGVSGNAGGLSGGRGGAHGVGWDMYNSANGGVAPWYRQWVTGGAGGGGYYGGGSGAVQGGEWRVSGATSAMLLYGAGGGRGSSFTAASVTSPTSGIAANAVAGGAGKRVNGRITLTWS